LVLDPAPFPGSNFLDFDRHTDVFQASYRWAIDRVDTLIATAVAMTALIQASK
jgi:hypothetical protein